jgi:hypothetical protein
VVVCEVPLNRLKQQLIVIAHELRPALADNHPPLIVFDRLHMHLIDGG